MSRSRSRRVVRHPLRVGASGLARLRRIGAPIATLVIVVFMATFAPVRTAHAGGPESAEPAETPNFSENTSGVQAGKEDATTKARATKSRKTPVSAKGSFTHSVPIQLPPGRLGMTPSLALSYDSASVAESAVGVGWSFGAPTITRSTREGFPKVHALAATPTYDEAAAIFTGPSGEMVPAVDGPAGASNLFAPARETSPVRYERITGSADRWVEHDPSGRKRYYGRNASGTKFARIANELGTTSWLLVREEDPFGNFIEYDYHNEPDASVGSNRPTASRKVAQRMPILKKVSWGGNTTTNPTSPFTIETFASPQNGPLDLLNGTTILEHRLDSMIVKIAGAEVWRYVLSYTTSETGKLLLTNVERRATGETSEHTTFSYSTGAPHWVDMGPMATESRFDSMYTDNSEWFQQNQFAGLYKAAVSNPVRAIQSPGFRSGLKMIDVDGNGTTDAVYLGSGIGNTESHILWTESALQSPATTGLGAWAAPQMGNPNASSLQPQTGLPFFPILTDDNWVPLWNRFDFGPATLRDLVDLDGDGDADGFALPFNADIRPGHDVSLPGAPPGIYDAPPPNGLMRIRVFNNHARSSGVAHPDEQHVGNWPSSVGLHTRIMATSTSDEPGYHPLQFKAEPGSDLSMPAVDLNADGKTDFVLLKRRSPWFNWQPSGSLWGYERAATAPPNSILRIFHSRRDPENIGEVVSGLIEVEIDNLVRQEHAIVLAADDLFTSQQRPETFIRYRSTASRLRIDELDPEIPVILMSRTGAIPAPTIPGLPDPPDPEDDYVPPVPPEQPWWWPQVDPEGDVFMPLRDHFYLKGGAFGSRLLFGEFRFVPRAILQRGGAARTFVAENDETSSRFEKSLQARLNNGSPNECSTLACKFPPHVNFNAFLADMNGDSLPDLVVAAPPQRVPDSAGRVSTRCYDGHEVFLNRGYGFESAELESGSLADWAPPSATAPLSRVTNRDRHCAVTRPLHDDVNTAFWTAPPTFPSAAMAQVDVNGDGRLDLVMAYQEYINTELTTQAVYVNTGRGFAPSSIALPPDVALARNIKFLTMLGAGSTLKWPRPGLTDMSRFIDLDNDGLIDIVRAGMCRDLPPIGYRDCRPAKWYRNEGNLPDRLEHVASTSGAWTTIEYADTKSAIMTIPEGGMRPPATTRLVKRITSAAGPANKPLDYPVEEIRLSYENYVKDLVSNEVLGFEKVKAEFVNSFDETAEETVHVTRTFDVQAEVLDGLGNVLPVRHPLKGALVSTITESGGWTATDLVHYSAEPLGAGVRVRPRREIHGDTSPTAISAWTAEETVSFDAFGNETEEISGNWDGAVITPVDHARTTLTEYENRTTSAWQIGLVIRTRSVGYSEDIAGTPLVGHLLGETTKTYYPTTAAMHTSTRVGIRGGTCAGADDDTTTFEYWPHGGVKKVTESNLRETNTSYEPRNLYPSSVSTSLPRWVDGVPGAAITLTVSYLTDERTGKTKKTTDPNNASFESKFDSRGRLLERKGPDGMILEAITYHDGPAMPLRQTSTIFSDVGKSFSRRTQLDADDHVLSVVEGAGSTAVPWSRKAKTRFDAFGRARQSFLPEIVSSIDGGEPATAGPKDATSYDGFDRPTQTLLADGTLTLVLYEPRETTEINARAIVTKRTFDAFGELAVVDRNVGGAASEHSSHSFVRDGRGEILQVVDGDASVRRFERDGGGRLLHVTLPATPGNPATQFSMCHDLDDGLVRLESAAGRVVDVTRDMLGRVVLSHGEDLNGLVVETTQNYDEAFVVGGKGRLTKKVDESGVYNLTYDTYGRPASVSFAPSARAIAGATNVAASYKADFVYTVAGHLKTATISNGLPQTAALVYTRDVKGRTTMVESKVGATPKIFGVDLAYDADDRLTFARYGNNTTGEWTFNPLNERLDRVAYKTSAGDVLSAVSYVYDPNGNPLEENREREGYLGVYSFKLHSYDALDRVLQSISSSPAGYFVEDHTFSPGGNILTAGGDAYAYASGVTSQAATQVVNATAGTQRDLAYDLDGYLATDAHALADGSTSSRTLAFDPTGCMRSISRVDVPLAGPEQTSSSQYTCGLDGKVVARATTKADGSTSRRIDFAGLGEIRPDEGVFVLRVPVSGSVSVEDARSLANGGRVSALSGYQANDLRGSVIASMPLEDSSQTLSKETEFDAWGKKLVDFTTMSSPRRGFAGAEADEAVGTYSFGARTYDPTLRRWVTPDPMLAGMPDLDEADGDNLNLFAYAGGNPLRRVDMSGYWGEDVKAMLRDSRAANGVAGFVFGLVQGLTPGGVLAPSPAKGTPHEAVFQHGQAGGQTIAGSAQVLAGGAAMGGGGAAILATDGSALLPGGATIAAGGVVAAHGTLVMSSAMKNAQEARAKGDAPAPPATPRGEVKAGSSSGAKASGTVRGKAPDQGPRRANATQRAEARDKSRGADGKARCTYCDKVTTNKPGKSNSSQIDHGKAYSRGGKTEGKNLFNSCRDCNLEKGAKKLGTEWTPPNQRK